VTSSRTDTFEAIPDSVLLDAAPPMGPRTPRGMLAPDKHALLCARCWTTFEGFSRTHCPQCRTARPDGGWSSLPYSFRDRYLFTRVVGRGGMGAVFLAFDEHQLDESRRAVAVKVVPTSGAPALRDALKRMFEREAAAAAMLAQSPNFVRVTSHDVGVEPAYLVMEFVDWPTLRALLRRGEGDAQPLTPVKAARIGVALLRGLSTMHFHRIVHRDLKPDNVFVRRTDSGEDYDVKILDLGVWTYDMTNRNAGHSLPGLDRPDEGSPVGTFSYMSPEQMTQGLIGATSDLHTVGSLLWELVTGQVPYPMPRKDLAPALRERVERMRVLPARPPRMPERLYDILCRALAFAPQDRWASADEMRGALKSWVTDTLRWTKSAVTDTKSRLLVMEVEAEGLLRRLSPTRELIAELEVLRDRLRADQRHADEIPLESLADALKHNDQAFHRLSGRLTAFAEAVHQGVLEGEAATGDLAPMEVGADGVPMLVAGPSVELDLADEPEEHASASISDPAALDEGSAKTAAPAALAPALRRTTNLDASDVFVRRRFTGAAAAGLVGLGVAAGAAVLWTTGPAAPPLRAAPAAPLTSPAPAAPAFDTRALGADQARGLDQLLGIGHTLGAVAVAWSPDGSRYASGGGDGVVVLWDAKSGAAVARVPVLEGGPVLRVAWTPDGGTLALTSADGRLRLWDAQSQTITGVAAAHSGPAGALAVTPDGRALVTGGEDGKVRVWSGASAALTAELSPPSVAAGAKRRTKLPDKPTDYGGVRALAADDARIVATYASGAVVQWGARGPGQLWSKAPADTLTLAVPHHAGWTALGGASGAITLVSAEAKEPRVLRGPGSAVTAVAASDDGQRLASAHADRSVRVWQVEAGVASASLAGATDELVSLALSPDGRYVLAGARDGSISLWEVSTGALVRRSPSRGPAVRAVLVDGDRATVVGPAVWRVDLATGTRLVALESAAARATLAVDAAGRRAVVAEGPTTLRLLDLATGAPGRRYSLPGPALAAALGPDAAWLAVATSDDRVRLWSTESSSPRAELPAARVRALASSADGRALAGVGDDGALHVWSAEQALATAVVDVALGPLTAVVWSPGGEAVAVGSADGRVARVDLATQQPTMVARQRQSPVLALAFAPHGRALAIAGSDDVVELSSLVDGGRTVALMDHGAAVQALAFGHDGAWLVAGMLDGTTRIHDLGHDRTHTVVEQAGQWIVVDARGHATCAPGPCPSPTPARAP
jgi:WD40 repeat protein/serine/threonine protein kinase